jgi:hypothetical protein
MLRTQEEVVSVVHRQFHEESNLPDFGGLFIPAL